MDHSHIIIPEIQEISSPEGEIQLSAAEESAIEECLTDPEGSLSSVDLNLFTDSPINAGKTKKSMAKRREERRNFKFLTAASCSDDDEDSQNSSSLSSISHMKSSSSERGTPPSINTRKTLEDDESRLNVRLEATEGYFKNVPSTSNDTNILACSNKVATEERNIIDINDEREKLTDATVPGNHQSVLLAPPRLSSIEKELQVKISNFTDAWLKNGNQSSKEDWVVKLPVGKESVSKTMKEDFKFQYEFLPSTSKDNNVIRYNEEKAKNREKLIFLKDKQKMEYTLNDEGITENDQASLLTPRISSIGKTYFEEKDQMSKKKKKQVESWVQNNFNSELDVEIDNGLEDEVRSESNNILNSVQSTSNQVVRQERKRNSSHSDRDAFSISAAKKKMKKSKRTKNPENHHIYTFFSSMADLVSTLSYDSTLAAKSKVTEVLKEIEKELIEWHKDPSPDKPMADFKMSEEDLKLISKKLAYLPYVY